MNRLFLFAHTLRPQSGRGAMRCCAALLVALALSLLTLAAPAFAATRNGTPQTECLSDYQNNPNGRVITQVTEYISIGCYGFLVTIAPPPLIQEMTICSISALPNNVVVDAQSGALQPPCFPFGTITIFPLSTWLGSLTVCSSSPIPTDWITLAETITPAAASTCVSDGGLYKGNPAHPIQRKILPPPVTWHVANPVCADSTIPPGFSIYPYTVTDSDCQLDTGNSLMLYPTKLTMP